jgi:hypothetical protein
MDDFLSRFSGELLGRIDEPFSFRFILQPVMAVFYAYRDGVKDARAGRPLYVLALAFIAYLLLRDPINRLVRRRLHATGER